MKYENIKGYIFCGGARNAGELFRIRKHNIDVTQLMWLTTGVEIGQIDRQICEKQLPILIFLN